MVGTDPLIKIRFSFGPLGTGQKLEGVGEGWCKHGDGHGFSCKHKREGQTILFMSSRGGGGGIIFYAKMLGSRSQSTIPL